MALNPADVPGVATRILALREPEQVRLHKIGEYVRGKHDSVYVPNGARKEYRWLMRRAVVNFLPLIVSTVAENLHVDGYRKIAGGDGTEGMGPLGGSPGEEEAPAPPDGTPSVLTDPGNPWSIFTANRMNSRQHGLHRAVIKYGIGYNVILPGTMTSPSGTDMAQPVIRPVSPRRLTALYADDVDDEWPLYAVEERVMRSERGEVRVVWLYDDQNRYTLVGKPSEPRLYWPGDWPGTSAGLVTPYSQPGVPSSTPVVEEHGLSVCPVVRFLHAVDLDGEMDVSGEVEPLMELQDQINTTTFNTLMAQQYAAFRQRWVTGMVPDDEDGRPREPFRSGVDRLFVAEDTDTKFGEFSATDLMPFINAREASIRHMATISQLPPYYLLGSIANLSADALAATRDALDRKVAELQGVLSDPWKQTMRLASLAAGNKEGWQDTASTVIWRDTSARAFAATADALGKMTQMLGIPATELWNRIPGVTAEEVAHWKQVAASQGPMAELNRIVEAQVTDHTQSAPPTEDAPFQGPAMEKQKGV